MRVFIRYTLIFLLLLPQLLWASNQERDIEAVFLGRLSEFIQLPDKKREYIYITLIDENPFGHTINELYSNKKIKDKPVKVNVVTSVEDIGDCDILFVTLTSTSLTNKTIEYAQRNAILTVSDQRSFAERGGIIQIEFINQKPKLKINLDSAIKSGIKIDSTLLAIAQSVISGGKNEINN